MNAPTTILRPEPRHAQILLELHAETESLEEVLDILKRSGCLSIRHEVVNDSHISYVLIVLASEDMREAALKLSEAGFNVVRGINALSSA